jgi:hypothetical protein
MFFAQAAEARGSPRILYYRWPEATMTTWVSLLARSVCPDLPQPFVIQPEMVPYFML